MAVLIGKSNVVLGNPALGIPTVILSGPPESFSPQVITSRPVPAFPELTQVARSLGPAAPSVLAPLLSDASTTSLVPSEEAAAMPFNVGGLLGALGGAASNLPVVGQFLGPALSIAGAAFASPAPAAPVASPLSFAVGPTATAGALVPALVGMAGRAVSILRPILAKASLAVGRRITQRDVIVAATTVGIDRAAAILGLSPSEVATVIVSRRRRRGRGISAADLRRTRLTIRKMNSFNRNLRELCAAPIARRRRAA